MMKELAGLAMMPMKQHEAMSPHIRAIDGVYPLDPAFLDAIKSGITTAHVMPGSANIIGGTTSVIKTYGKNIDKMIIQEIAGLKIALGENPKRIHSHGNNDSITSMGIMGMLRETFYKAIYSDHPDSLRLAPISHSSKERNSRKNSCTPCRRYYFCHYALQRNLTLI